MLNTRRSEGLVSVLIMKYGDVIYIYQGNGQLDAIRIMERNAAILTGSIAKVNETVEFQVQKRDLGLTLVYHCSR